MRLHGLWEMRAQRAPWGAALHKSAALAAAFAFILVFIGSVKGGSKLPQSKGFASDQ
jgi:hypothetical protein